MSASRSHPTSAFDDQVIYRPQFSQDVEAWQQLLKLAREMGVDNALRRMSDDYHRVEKVERDDELRFDSYSTRIKSIDDLVHFHEIDTAIWEPDAVTTNYYEQGAKLPNGEIVKTPLHQIKARFKRKREEEHTFEQLKSRLVKAIEDVKGRRAPSEEEVAFAERLFAAADLLQIQVLKPSAGLMLEPMITDLHLGKIGFDFHAMDYNWSVKESQDAYLGVIENMLERLKGERIDHFVLPTGNDLLNIDNAASLTTKGTPQLSALFWEHLFTRAAQMLVVAIDRLLEVAPVKVVFVRGNHDSQSVFSLGEMIAAHYRNESCVTVDNSFEKRKYHDFQEVLLGFFHFDIVKPNAAAQAIMADRPSLAHLKYKAIHGGHLHKNSKRLQPFDLKNEVHGVEVEVCPSLSPTDRWHYENLFIGNLRRSKTFVWSGELGLLEELYFQLA